MMKYSKDGVVCFDPVKHTYHNGSKYLQGVTGLIERFKTPFNEEEVATKYAAKHGLDKDQLLKEWKEKGKKSRDDGTAVHQMIESYITTGSYSFTGAPKEASADLFIKQYFKSGKLIPVEAEMIVYNDHIATQIDCIARNPQGDHFILDWKTNSKVSDNGYGKFMKRPFHRYPDASFFHYSLQLTLNKLLCKEYQIKDAFIVHLKERDFEIMNIETMRVPQEVLTNELSLI